MSDAREFREENEALKAEREEVQAKVDGLAARLKARMEEWEEGARALREQKDTAYAERNRLVAALSKVFPSHLMRHPDDPEWEDDWKWIVCVELPTGQATWHLHDTERCQFDHLEVRENCWDGHDTEEKYRRLSGLEAALAKYQHDAENAAEILAVVTDDPANDKDRTASEIAATVVDRVLAAEAALAEATAGGEEFRVVCDGNRGENYGGHVETLEEAQEYLIGWRENLIRYGGGSTHFRLWIERVTSSEWVRVPDAEGGEAGGRGMSDRDELLDLMALRGELDVTVTALAAAEKQRDAYRAALEFYANAEFGPHGDCLLCGDDIEYLLGRRARKALEEQP